MTTASTGRALFAHLSAMPLGFLLAVPLGFVASLLGGHAIDVQLHDTMYVVAHMHLPLSLGACLALATLVARRWGRFNAALLAGWGFLLVHLVADAFIARSIQGLADPEPDSFRVLIPDDPSWFYAYFGSACASLLALVAGLCMSFARRPRAGTATSG